MIENQYIIFLIISITYAVTSNIRFIMQQFLTRSALALLIILGQLANANAQLTIKVTAIPANTPPGSSIYVAGTFNTWNPGDATKILTPLGGGQFQIVLNPPVGTVEFKFTRGSWATVEGNANGGFYAVPPKAAAGRTFCLIRSISPGFRMRCDGPPVANGLPFLE